VVLPCVNVLLQSGHAPDAEAALRRAIGANPNDAHLAAALGVTLAVENRPEEAVKELEHAGEIDQADPDALGQLGQLMAEMGRRDEDAKWEERAVRAAGSTPGGVR